jgi:hypothetical protein
MNTLEFYSHEQQDEFIFNLFNGKSNGFFLDIAAGHPMIGSNTYMLEKNFNWTGIGFDIYDSEALYQWSQLRQSRFVAMDVCTEQMTTFLSSNIPSDLVVDYVSLDVNGPAEDLVLVALEKVLDAGVKFKACTFEHEFHRGITGNRDKSRQLLEARGMKRLFGDVKLWGLQFEKTGEYSFEDWWVDPAYFEPEILSIQADNLFYCDAVSTIKNYRNIPHIAVHNCCRAFRDEYKTFWNPSEHAEIMRWFEQIK